jgi:hypothetical protein
MIMNFLFWAIVGIGCWLFFLFTVSCICHIAMYVAKKFSPDFIDLYLERKRAMIERLGGVVNRPSSGLH